MSTSVLDGFDANNAQEVMDKENYGQSPGVQTVPNSGGRRFSDVTNTLQFSSSRKPTPESFHLAAHFNSKSNAEHFHQEISYLKRMLAEKEATLESTKQELQKAWYKSFKSSQQNKQLTQANGQMFAELCMLREKVKLFQHEYNSMSAAFRVKGAELEKTVRDLSEQLQRRNQITKDPEQTESSLQYDSQFLHSITNEKSSKNPGEICTRVNLAAKEVKKKAKRMARQQLVGEAESMADPVDQSNASFRENNLEEVLAGGFCKKDDSSLRKNGSTKEEDLKEKRTCLRRQPTSVSYKELPLHKKVRYSQKASAKTLDDIDHHTVSMSTLETLGDPCTDYSNKEGDCSEVSHVSLNEETSNGKRLSLRRRSANISYKEPALKTKLRKSGSSMPTQKFFQSDMQSTSLNAQGTLDNLSEKDVCKEPCSLRTNSAIEENQKCKRACSRQSVANTPHRDSFLKENAQKEQKAVTTPSFSGLHTLDNVGEGHGIGFDVTCSDAVHVELSEFTEGCKNWNFTNKEEDITGDPTKMQQQQVQEIGHCSASAIKTAPETTELGWSQTTNSALKTVEFVASSKEIPLGGNVSEVQELHSDVPQPGTASLSNTSECSQNISLSNTESDRIKPPAARQLKVQRTATSFNTALNAAELRRSLTGRPVRKAAETVASYKEIPVNIKMRRCQ